MKGRNPRHAPAGWRRLIACTAAVLIGSGAARRGLLANPWTRQPFQLQDQDAGTGTKGPRPKADPYCGPLRQDNQNVTQLGC